jgi:glycosyltransferase involved in cell wall biosynthesis
MKIWIINPYGNLPDEGWREYRSTLIANAFARRNHEVVWWVSNFEHRSKKFRSETWKDIQINDKYVIRLVPSTPYYSHISFARIRHERNYAKNLLKEVLKSKESPDLIILAEPSLFYSDIIIGFIHKRKVPLIIDILDLWPELFHIILPNVIGIFGRIIFAPFYWKRSWLLRQADGIIGATRDYLAVGTSKNKTAFNEVAYLGIDLASVGNMEYHEFSDNHLNEFKKELNEIWIIYAGTLGKNYDIPIIIECSRKLNELKLPIKIFLAGDGELRQFVEESIRSKNLSNLIYLGKLSANDLNLFYKKCDIALSTYVKNSTVSMPVKAFDYFAAGLPVVNSLNRDLGYFIKSYNAGLQYKAENIESMLNAIRYLSENRHILDEMKANALTLGSTFDSASQSDKVVTMAEKLICITD